MDIFYVTINRKIQYTKFEQVETYYFNSEHAQKAWIKTFQEQGYTLQKIIDKGIAFFNECGILNP